MKSYLRCRAVMGMEQARGFLRLAVLDEMGAMKKAEQFTHELSEEEKRQGRKVILSIEVREYKKPRNQRQLGLYWLIVERIASVDAMSPEQVHEGIKAEHYPRVHYGDLWVPKHPLNSEEMSRVIECTLAEGSEKGADLSDLWALWVEPGAVKDKHDVEYQSLEDFMVLHPFCDACGIKHSSMEWAHIWPKGSGGPTEPWNLLHLGSEHHVPEQHSQGWEMFLEKYPHLKPKVAKAMERRAI
jgi:hypothetical protein